MVPVPRNQFIPWTPEYQFHNVQPIRSLAYAQNEQIEIGRGRIVPNRTYRFWPPRMPGQHVAKDFEAKAAYATKDRIDTPNDQMPKYVDPKTPIRYDYGPLERGTYYWIRFPPQKVRPYAIEVVNGIQRSVIESPAVGNFPLQKKLIEDSNVYEPVRVYPPARVTVVEKLAPIAGQPSYFARSVLVPEKEYIFFPPPKAGQDMSHLSDEFKMFAEPRVTQRVWQVDSDSKQIIGAFRYLGDTELQTPGRVRQRKSARGVVGGQPTMLMKYAVLNRARTRPILNPPMSPAVQDPGPSPQPGTSTARRLSPKKSPSKAVEGKKRSALLYTATEEEAGSGPESDDEDEPHKKKKK